MKENKRLQRAMARALAAVAALPPSSRTFAKPVERDAHDSAARLAAAEAKRVRRAAKAVK